MNMVSTTTDSGLMLRGIEIAIKGKTLIELAKPTKAGPRSTPYEKSSVVPLDCPV